MMAGTGSVSTSPIEYWKDVGIKPMPVSCTSGCTIRSKQQVKEAECKPYNN